MCGDVAAAYGSVLAVPCYNFVGHCYRRDEHVARGPTLQQLERSKRATLERLEGLKRSEALEPLEPVF